MLAMASSLSLNALLGMAASKVEPSVLDDLRAELAALD